MWILIQLEARAIFLINIIFYNKGISDIQTLFGTSCFEGYKLK